MANAGNPALTAAPTSAPAAPPNVFQQSQGAFTGALGAAGTALGGPNINAFMNPYTSAVTDTTMSGLDRARKMAMVDVGAAATKAGAFGGSRHGVLEAETNKNFFDTAASTLAGLNKSGFDTALGGAQAQQGIQLAGADRLSSIGQALFGTGQSISGGLAQQGGQQQMLVQALIDAAKGQFGGFTGAPQASLSGPLAALSGANMGQNTSTTKQQPGLLNILGAVFGMS